MTALLTNSATTHTSSPRVGRFETVALSCGEALRYSPAWPILERAYRGDAQASFDQRPECIDAVLSATPEWKDRPALIVHGESAHREPIAAIFIPKNVSTKKIPAFGVNCTLRGYRLAGNRLLGRTDDPSAAEQLLAASLERLGQSRAQVVLIEDLDIASPLSQVVESHLPRTWQQFAPRGWQTRHRLFFPASERKTYWDKFSSKKRGTFRRTVKKIGDIRVARATEPSDVVDFLRDAHQVSLETWQSQTLGLRVKNDDRELTVFGATAALGAFRSYLLYRDEQPIAFLIGMQSHGIFLVSELGYVQSFSRFSPGQVLLHKILDDLIDDAEVAQLDFGFGDAGYKEIFGTHVSKSADIWLMPENWTTTLVRSWGRTTQSLARTSKSFAQRIGAAAALKKTLRKIKSLRRAASIEEKHDHGPATGAGETSAE
ncbi:MAG: GNAT family N-acetyltransferase [Planctomycetaceae bacterium]